MLTHSLPELSARLRAGHITAENLTRSYLERIDKYDALLEAYEWVDREGALERARAVDALRTVGTDLGPLMGLPVAIKDLLHVDGMPARAGSLLDVSGAFQPEEGELVRKLRAAGCVILGKTKTAEFALSSSGINYRNGTPINPHSPELPRVPGGSSSGSAVAVAADLCAFAIGTDTGGSVRTPAAYCGIVGIKYGWGALDPAGAFPLSETLDSYGIFTHRVECAQLVTQALGLAGPALHAPAPLKLGVLTTYRKLQLDPEVEQCWNTALDCLARDGHTVQEVGIEAWHGELDKVYSTITRAEVFTTLSPYLSADAEALINPDILRKIRSGAGLDAPAYISALRRRQALIQAADGLFNDYDALITPTKPTVPPTYPASYAGPAQDDLVLAKTGVLTREANVLNMSGASLPIHQHGSRLPVGFQILCRGDDLDGLLRCAAAVEKSVGVAAPCEL